VKRPYGRKSGAWGSRRSCLEAAQPVAAEDKRKKYRATAKSRDTAKKRENGERTGKGEKLRLGGAQHIIRGKE